MRALFFGTPPVAAQLLEELVAQKINIVAVVSKPDKPKGRSSKPVPTAVKVVAEKHGIAIHQPDSVSDPLFIPILSSYDADLFIVFAYGEIVKENVLELPHKACINLHASLLPSYRGAAPIQWALINGETKSGVSVIHMAKKMDAGDILAQEEISIGTDETFGELQERLCSLGVRTLYEVIKAFESGAPLAYPQDHNLATFAPKIELGQCKINWEKPAKEIHNLVRGVNPYPGAWTKVCVRGEEKILKIYASKVVEASPDIVENIAFKDDSLFVVCGDSTRLSLVEVQLEGKKRMSGADLIRGIGKENFRLL